MSALVSFELFVRPALLAAQGHPSPIPKAMHGTLEHDIPKGGGRREYRRGVLRNIDGRFRVRVFGTQSSGALSSIAGANALVLVPAGAPAGCKGDTVSVIPLSGHLGLDDGF